MNAADTIRAERMRTMWLGTGALLLVTILGAVVRASAGSHAAAMVALVYGVGVFAMAWLAARATAYPRWAWFASAGVFALALATTALLFHSPAQVKTWTSMAWMMPWLFLVLGLTPGPKAGWCSPRSPWAGLLLIGVSVVYSAILIGACWLTR
jgi:hypothetical protein